MIWSITFFAWYTSSTSSEDIDQFKHNWDEDVFAAIELMKQQYDTIMNMPVMKLKNLLRWKDKLEKDKENMIEEIKNG